MRGWANVGVWVALCFRSWRKFLYTGLRPRFARLTQSQAGNLEVNTRSVFITTRSMTDTNKFHFFFIFWNSFWYKITVSFTMVIKRSPGGESTSGGQSTSKSTCVVPAWTLTAFSDRPASSMSKFSVSVNSYLGNGSFWVDREIRDAEHVDRCSWKCTQVWSHQLTSDLKRRLLFWKCFSMVVSESSFGAYVCLRRPAGSTATSGLVYSFLPKCSRHVTKRKSVTLFQNLSSFWGVSSS